MYFNKICAFVIKFLSILFICDDSSSLHKLMSNANNNNDSQVKDLDKKKEDGQALERTASKNVLLNPYYQPEEDTEMEKYVKENHIVYQQDDPEKQDQDKESENEDNNAADQNDRRCSVSVSTEHEEIVKPDPPRKRCEIPWGSIIGIVVLLSFIVLIVIAAT